MSRSSEEADQKYFAAVGATLRQQPMDCTEQDGQGPALHAKADVPVCMGYCRPTVEQERRERCLNLVFKAYDRFDGLLDPHIVIETAKAFYAYIYGPAVPAEPKTGE